MNEIEFLEELDFLLTQSARYKVLFGGRGAGKCLALGTKVIMADGSLRAIENIWPGESVMGPDSKPRKVLGTTRGRSEMYKIHQTSAMSYVVNSAHILSLKKSNSCKREIGEISKAGNARRPNGRYSSYSDITNINVVEASEKSERWRSHFRGYRAGLLHFPEAKIKIDPWYLGAWLGDGKYNDTIIYTIDKEIINECEKYAKSLDLEISFYPSPNTKCVGVKIKKIYGNGILTNPLNQLFIEYNLFNNKHIPKAFKINSEKNRLELLAGLLDTDGHLHHNGYEIIQTNKTLAQDIKFLADSLGFRTYMREKITTCSNNGVKGIGYRITINGDTWRIPCRLPRKKVKKEDVRKNKDFLLSQIKIENIGEGEYAGFSLDGDHLFLLEDGTVTHNTEGVAIALIIWATRKKIRILCLREFLNSISESVYSMLKAKIYALGLEDEFDIQATTIISKRTGSEFIFKGLRYNIDTIKSLAAIDIAWIEEANNVSATSWDKLGPTIRGRHKDDPNGNIGPFGKGPEIWITFNPELDTDETYKRFVLNPPNEYDANGNRYSIVKKLNWSQNKWFPDDLREEMTQLKAKNINKWLEVWEGNTKQVLDGAIYAEEIRQLIVDRRLGKVPYDTDRPVHTFWDLGHSDQTAIWFIQTVGLEYNIINYYQNNLKKIGHYLEYLQSLNYVYGIDYLPHDADNETLASRSVNKLMLAAGRKTRMVQRPAKKFLGINAARTVFPLCNFDETNTKDGVQCLRRYCYKINQETGNFSKEPDHDTPWSHGADAFQTFALSLKSETASKKPIRTVAAGHRFGVSQQNGWMG